MVEARPLRLRPSLSTTPKMTAINSDPAAPKAVGGALGPHDVQAYFNFAGEEERVLEYCQLPCSVPLPSSADSSAHPGRSIDAFQESVRQSKDRKPYSFYDGPVESPSVIAAAVALLGRRALLTVHVRRASVLF